MDLDHPAFQSIILPLTLAFVMAGVLRLVGGPGRGAAAASAAVAIALLAGAVLLLGLPAWPPRTALHKFTYLLGAGLVIGLLLDLKPPAARVRALLAVLWVGLMCLWLAWPQLHRAETLWMLAGLGVAGILVVWRVERPGARDLGPAVMFLVAAAGLGGIAFNSGSLVIAQLSFALAAAIGGFALWNWPAVRFPFGAAARFGAGLPVLGLAALALFLTNAPPWAVAILVMVFFADLVSGRIPPRAGAWHRVLAPVYLAAVAAVPAALAVALVVAFATGQPDDLYYR